MIGMMEYWKTGIMGNRRKRNQNAVSLEPIIPTFHYSTVPVGDS